MTLEQFLKHKEDNPHIKFLLSGTNYIPIEKTWFKEYGIYSLYKRDFYIKSNSKKCYVDTFIKEIKIERSKLCPCKNSYAFCVKNSELNNVIFEALKSV